MHWAGLLVLFRPQPGDITRCVHMFCGASRERDTRYSRGAQRKRQHKMADDPTLLLRKAKGGVRRAGHKNFLAAGQDHLAMWGAKQSAESPFPPRPAHVTGQSRILYCHVPLAMDSISIIDWHLSRRWPAVDDESNPFARIAAQAWPAD